MKIKNSALVFLAAFFFCLCVASHALADDDASLSVGLKPERQQYISGEQIYVGVVIKNASEKPVLIPTTWALGGKLLIEIEGYGETLDPFIKPVDLAYETALLLHPDAEHVQIFGWGETAIEHSPKFEYGRKYRIRATFKSNGTYLAWDQEKRRAVPSPCWKGEVVSDWVEFEIIEPSGDEDKAAYALLTNNNKDIWKALDLYDHDTAPTEALEKIMQQHPKSTYARIICETLTARTAHYPMTNAHLEKIKTYRQFAAENWANDILGHVIDTYIIQSLIYLREYEKARALIRGTRESTDTPRVIAYLGYFENWLKQREAEDAARTPNAPPQETPEPPTGGQTPGPPNATGTGTSSQGGAEGAIAEATPFPWAIVIVIAIAALALGAVTTLLLTRKNRREA
jgi:hypothetical protein